MHFKVKRPSTTTLCDVMVFRWRLLTGLFILLNDMSIHNKLQPNIIFMVCKYKEDIDIEYLVLFRTKLNNVEINKWVISNQAHLSPKHNQWLTTTLYENRSVFSYLEYRRFEPRAFYNKKDLGLRKRYAWSVECILNTWICINNDDDELSIVLDDVVENATFHVHESLPSLFLFIPTHTHWRRSNRGQNAPHMCSSHKNKLLTMHQRHGVLYFFILKLFCTYHYLRTLRILF